MFGPGLIASALALTVFDALRSNTATDLSVYLRIGREIFTFSDDVYAPFAGLPFTYPPFAALLFGVMYIATGPLFGVALTTGGILAYSYIVYSLTKWAVDGRSSRLEMWVPWIVVPATIWFEPMCRNILLGQFNLVLLAATLWAYSTRREWLSGVLVGVCAGIKLTPAFYGLYFLVARKWRAAAWSVAGGLGTVAIGWVFLPKSSVEYWSGVAFDAGRVGGQEFAGNQSINGALYRLAGGEPSSVLKVVLLVLAFAVCAWACHRHRESPIAAFSVVSLGGVLLSPISWSHHWVAVFPLFAVLARLAGHRIGAERVINIVFFVCGIALMATWAIWATPTYGGQEFHAPPLAKLAHSSYVLWGAAALVYLSVAKPEAPSPEGSDSPESKAPVARS